MAEQNAIASQIGDLASAGEKMIERLRRKAFLPESRKGLNVRFGIAEADLARLIEFTRPRDLAVT